MLLNTGNDNIGQQLTGLDTPYGDFNFFSRPSHWTMTMHKHPFFQFLLVISGDLKIITGQSETLLERGMVSIIPPEVPHNLMSEAGYNQFGINLISDAPEDSLIKILTSYIDAPVIINNPGLLDLLPEIEDCARLQTMVSIQKIRNRLEYMLLNCVEMIKRQDTNQAFREKLMDYFRERLSENLALEELSKDFFMSPSHIERLSYMEFGCGAMHLFNRLKMDRARMLLQNTNLPISDISGRLGYEDQGYFSRVFRKYAGMSPRKYQKWRKM